MEKRTTQPESDVVRLRRQLAETVANSKKILDNKDQLYKQLQAELERTKELESITGARCTRLFKKNKNLRVEFEKLITRYNTTYCLLKLSVKDCEELGAEIINLKKQLKPNTN